MKAACTYKDYMLYIAFIETRCSKYRNITFKTNYKFLWAAQSHKTYIHTHTIVCNRILLNRFLRSVLLIQSGRPLRQYWQRSKEGS